MNMKRRNFLQTSITAPFLLRQLLADEVGLKTNYLKANEKSFEILEVKGSYKQIGFQIGHYFGDNIKQVIKARSDWHTNLLNNLRSEGGNKRSKEYLRLTQKYFPHFLDEIRGMADGAGLHFDTVWAMCIKSELEALDEEPQGCSTICYKDEKKTWLFHNEDGNVAYADLMFVLKAKPPSGVNYVSMVYPGIITGNGPSLNNKGIIQTTNFIGSTESSIGLPRYIIGRAVLEAKNIDEAIDIITMEPRAFPYHHNIGSILQNKYLSVETTPITWQVKEPEGIYYHTNHLLFDKTRKYESEDGDYKQTSSMSRYQVIQDQTKNLDLHKLSPEDLINILASHKNAPYSPCRHPQGEVKGATLGTAFYDYQRNVFRLFKGNPCKASRDNLYIDFHLDEILN